MSEPQHGGPTAQDAAPPATPVWVKALGVALAWRKQQAARAVRA